MSSLVYFRHSLLKKRAGLASGEFTYGTEYYSWLRAVQRPVFSDHVLPPTCDPDFGSFSTNE
jgi:hypothetical protein